MKKGYFILAMPILVIMLASQFAMGDDALHVDTNGYVGIGTNTPEQKLHISAGNLQLDNFYYITWGDHKVIEVGDSNNLWIGKKLEAGGTPKLYFASNDF